MRTERKIINGNEWSVASFVAVEAFKLKARLVKIIAPAISGMLQGVSSLDSEIKGVNIGEAISKLSEILDETEFLELVRRLLQNATCTLKGKDGKKQIVLFADDFDTAFNVVFDGRLFDVYKVIQFVLEVNFPDFFQMLPSFTGGKTSKIATLLREEKTLTTE